VFEAPDAFSFKYWFYFSSQIHLKAMARHWREGERQMSAVARLQSHEKFDERARRKKQHELKIYIEKYFKEKLGKGVDHTRVTIWEDIIVIRGEGFLTEPERYLLKTLPGKDIVNAARMHVAKLHARDNVPYIEKLLSAKVIHQSFLVEAEQDFWMHVMVMDHPVTQDSPKTK
jgi:uncharacterized protein YbcI